MRTGKGEVCDKEAVIADDAISREHVQRIQGRLEELITEVRENIYQVEDAPQAKALFEVTAEVLTGLKTAYQHYEEKSETAWEGSI